MTSTAISYSSTIRAREHDEHRRHGLDDREPRVRLSARQVRRDDAHHLKQRVGSPHGVRRVPPDCP